VDTCTTLQGAPGTDVDRQDADVLARTPIACDRAGGGKSTACTPLDGIRQVQVRPNAHLTANTDHCVADYYIAEFRKVLAGTWTGDGRRQTASEHMVVRTPLNKSVFRPTVARLFEEKKRPSSTETLPFGAGHQDNNRCGKAGRERR